MADQLSFRGVVEAARGGGAMVRVPDDVAAALGGMKRMRIVGTVNGVGCRSSTMPFRGALFLGLHKATRESAGVSIGDEIDVVLARDDSPRVLELAPEFEAALAAEPALRARFDALSFSHRREVAAPIAEAKRPETRARRVEAALQHLRAMA